ncbi:MAG: GNAT family N-acetyltransferase [Actinomycetota bacterium]|nr:MAG: putative acetyltransferase [Acidimicrobiaceae bacterium]
MKDIGWSAGAVSFVDNESSSRYEVIADNSVVGFCEYVNLGAEVVLSHTVIDPSMRARGLATRLVRFALDDLTVKGVQVVPDCWFVAEFIDAHPEFHPLLAS